MLKVGKIVLKAPGRYQSKALKLQNWIKQYNPIFYIEHLCNLKGLPKIYVIHKPLQLSAEFKLPNKIFLGFHNAVKYIALSIAHEYAHLLLRANTQLDYSVEQALAILLQLSYEEHTDIRKFSKSSAKELMEFMKVWPTGKILLKHWLSYWRHSKNYHNVLTWLEKMF